MYTITSCQFSKLEREYLASHSLQFEEKNLENNREFLTEMLAVGGNFAGTPVTKIEKDDGKIEVLKGFTAAEFDKTLGLATAAAPGVEPVKPVESVEPVAVAQAPVEKPVAPVVPEVVVPVVPTPTPVVEPVKPVESVEPVAAVAPAPMPDPAMASLLNNLQQQAQVAAPVAPATPAPVAPAAPMSAAPVIPDPQF